MKNSLFILIVVTLLHISVSHAHPIELAVEHAKPAPGSSIVVFGDSQAAGEGSTTPESHFDHCLQRNFPAFKFSTLAKRGTTTADGKKWLPELLALNPRVVVISLGGNDIILIGGRVPATETFENLTYIYRELISRGIMVVQLGLNPPMRYARRLAEIEPYALNEGALFIPDILEGLWGDSTYMADFIHPNDLGYKMACDKIVPAIAPYLQ